MLRLSFGVQDGLQDLDDFASGEAGFGGFAERSPQQLARPFGLGIATAIDGALRDEGAEPLPAVDDSLALELLVRALDGDDADEELLGEPAEGGQRRPGRQAPFAHLALEAVDDCW